MRENKRLFVGNLPPNATENDLAKEFAAYGKVLGVDVKTKEGNANNKFGFVNIEMDDYMTRQCIQEFKDTAYKGCFLNVSVAKESFLDKLKREREEAAAQDQKKTELASRPKAADVEDERDEFVIKPSKYKAEPVHKQLGDDEDLGSSFTRRNKGAYFENGKVKILGGTGARLHADDNDGTNPGGQANGTANESNQKRLESLQKLKKAHDQQKFAIRNALKNSDVQKNKKIVFDADDVHSGAVKRSQLFDNDDDGDYSNDFKSKKQFEGLQGQKLLELKTRFKNDDRFQMDEDFHEAGPDEKMHAETDQQGERQRQLEILGSVVGKSFIGNRKKGAFPTTMLRFDPSKPTHQKFYKQAENADEEMLEDHAEEMEMPKVSSDQFYKVSNSIGEAIKGQSEGFSLLKMMGHADNNEDAAQYAGDRGLYHAEPLERRGKTQQSYNENPFKYDSSDDESGAKKKKRPTGEHARPVKVGGKTNKRGIFRENFFILDGDARLEQGLAFFTAGSRDKLKNFREIKQKLKLVASKKVRKSMLMQRANSGRKVFKKKK